ncbi:unnamed protein product [Mesocestoides corti]|uniref:RING-type domain-containing protein n=1 Tax=Mesocestoides corti TaxID=53468 RepID=A0A0R3UE38_MESCO|nr:unnamed protein product [Mesocestoides corti]
MAIVLCSQLPISRLILYGVFSFLLSCFALWRCASYYSPETDEYGSSADGRHVRSLESAMRDNCVVVAVFNLVFFLLIAIVKMFQQFFFGPLVGTEPRCIREKSMHFALSRAVFLIGVINAAKWSSLMGWTLWFGCLGCLHGFACLARLRCEQLIARNSTSIRQWLRFGSMLIALTCGTVALLSSGVKFCRYLSDLTPEADIFGEIGSRYHNEDQLNQLGVADYPEDSSADFYQILHTLIFIFSDSANVLLLLLQVALIIIVNELDGTKWIHKKMFFDKAIWLYNVSLIFDVICLTLDFSNHVHMLIWSRLASLTSLVVCIQVIVSYGDLAQRLRRHSAYQNLVKIIRREFPLEQIDRKTVNGVDDLGEHKSTEPETCAICWELLWTWRKLPCRHCFHETCLTMWIEEDPSCPTCRRPVLPRTPRPRAQQRVRQPPAFNTLRDVINFFSRENAAGLPQRNAENQRAVRGVFLRLRQRSVAPNDRNTRAPGRSLDVSIHISLGPSRPAPQTTPQPSAEVHGGNPVASPDQQPQTQIIQSTTHSRIYHFDGSNYLSWLPTIDIEFVETEQNVSPLITNQPPAEPTAAVTQQPQRRSASLLSRLPRLPAAVAAAISDSQRRHASIQTLSSALRAQAEQISAAFPDVPLDAILADLAVTRVPEATVENLLSGQTVTLLEGSLVEERPHATHSDSSPHEELERETQVRNRHTAQLPSATSASSSAPNVEVGETTTPGGDALSSQQQQPTPSSLIAQRRQQMLVRARQRFLAAQKH